MEVGLVYCSFNLFSSIVLRFPYRCLPRVVLTIQDGAEKVSQNPVSSMKPYSPQRSSFSARNSTPDACCVSSVGCQLGREETN
eukprot:1324530-Amorphochlora_amoeboformis.AAC.1